MTAFWVNNINEIGGVETFLFEIAKKYWMRDIEIYYRYADLTQLNRLRRYVRCVHLKDRMTIKCDTIITNYDTTICDRTEAKHYYCIIHSDHLTQKTLPVLNDKIDKYFGCSENACENFTKITGLPCELLVNPLTVEKPQRVLHLLSATRLSPEKGKERMIALNRALDEASIPYLWTIFTNDKEAIDNKNIVYMEPRLDIRDYIADADYLVQLSSSEARSYSVSEALALGTPCIVSEHPSFRYQGVSEKTGYILPYDMSDIPVEDIYRKIPKFEPIKINDRYGEIIDNSKTTYSDAERRKAYENTDGIMEPKIERMKNMNIEMVNEWGNCIKVAKSQGEYDRLRKLGFKAYTPPKVEAPKAEAVTVEEPKKKAPKEETPKAEPKKQTTKRTVKKNEK